MNYSFHLFHQRAATLLCAIAVLFGFGAADVAAAKKISNVTVVPTIESLQLVDGQLVASGSVSGTLRGRDFTAPFENVPVDIALAEEQPADAVCDVLALSLGPINLDVLGLVVETSPICLEITADPTGGLLGSLLCSVANLLNQGLPIGDILSGLGVTDGLVQVAPGLTQAQIGDLLGGLTDLLNGVLENLLNAIITDIIDGNGTTCSILHLELAPIELNLLGLIVNLDNCDGGNVVVDITGERGAGNLLGNLLCGLLGGSNLGDTLGDLLDAINLRLN
ncbi:MAG TPA: hypothetical protein VF773_12860 [Verrucomicrobiae bacterium]